MMTTTRLDFDLPDDRVASTPPEARGLARDEVRLMVAGPGGIQHSRFDRLAEHLLPGDLLVVNSSPTMPAAVPAWARGEPVVVHFSTAADDGTWTVEVRQPDRSGPVLDLEPGSRLGVPGGSLAMLEPAGSGPPGGTRLWRASVDVDVRELLAGHGRPIRYAYVPDEWPLDEYQTLFADVSAWPGSAEMASAARPFSRRLLRDLRKRNVGIAAIQLHAGVSSPELNEPPRPEHFLVDEDTANAIYRTRLDGGRVIAVGTTVTRALESAAAPRFGLVLPRSGWTDLVLGSDRAVRVVDGLITGWHAAEASHLHLLEAVAGLDLVAAAYRSALSRSYLWHEFGDSCLLLPSSVGRRRLAA